MESMRHAAIHHPLNVHSIFKPIAITSDAEESMRHAITPSICIEFSNPLPSHSEESMRHAAIEKASAKKPDAEDPPQDNVEDTREEANEGEEEEDLADDAMVEDFLFKHVRLNSKQRLLTL